MRPDEIVSRKGKMCPPVVPSMTGVLGPIIVAAHLLIVSRAVVANDSKAPLAALPTSPITAQNTPVRRPTMPAEFDEHTVQELLDAVEGPHNAAVLKLGYFSRRGRHALPIRDGYKLLEASLQHETIGSQRWFYLQNIRGWAAFHVQEVPAAEGFDAYDAIFLHAADAKPNKAVFVLNLSVHDYVSAVTGRLRDMRLVQDARAKATALNAWLAYSTVSYTNDKPGFAPSWPQATIQLGLEKELAKRIGDLDARPQTAPSYNLLTTCASILAQVDPERALEAMRQAKPLRPKDMPRETRRFSDLMVRLLTYTPPKVDGESGPVAAGSILKPELDKIGEAASFQKETVDATGYGRAALFDLYAQLGDEAGQKRILTELAASNAAETEVIDVADQLRQHSGRGGAIDERSEAVSLLFAYLKSNRSRTPEQEVRARLTLATLLYMDGQFVTALEVTRNWNYEQKLRGPRATAQAASLEKLGNILARRAQENNASGPKKERQ